jgi:hypothetical protein
MTDRVSLVDAAGAPRTAQVLEAWLDQVFPILSFAESTKETLSLAPDRTMDNASA